MPGADVCALLNRKPRGVGSDVGKTISTRTGAATVDGGVMLPDVFANQPGMTENESAARLGIQIKTLQAWRSRGKRRRFVRFGRAVRYLPAHIDAFIRASTVDTRREGERVRR
jgi:hypothetical protein